jgi:hypothetical protein
MYSRSDLERVKKLITAAGLIKVYDGNNWIDLRLVMTDVVNQAIELIDASGSSGEQPEGIAE